MRKPVVVFLAATLAALCLPVCAADYQEQEPNDSVPSAFLPGNPIFFSGDRLLGSITAGDSDNHFLTLDGSGPAGLYRYTFTTSTGGGDSVLSLFDTTTLPDGFGYQLGLNDDFPGLGLASRIIFDQFVLDGSNPVFDVNIEGFSATSAFAYALTVERAPTPVTDLGTLGGLTSVTGTNLPGAGFWYSFTLAVDSDVTIDTAGSAISDTTLALFEGAGNTIAANDDGPGIAPRSRISGALSAGTYHLALGSYLFDPSTGEEVPSFYNWDELLQAPAGWDRDGFSSSPIGGGHRLNISVATVPEPGTIVLLGVGGLTLLWRRRRLCL